MRVKVQGASLDSKKLVDTVQAVLVRSAFEGTKVLLKRSQGTYSYEFLEKMDHPYALRHADSETAYNPHGGDYGIINAHSFTFISSWRPSSIINTSEGIHIGVYNTAPYAEDLIYGNLTWRGRIVAVPRPVYEFPQTDNQKLEKKFHLLCDSIIRSWLK